MQTDQINSFKALKDSGYKPKSIKEELRSNLWKAKSRQEDLENWGFDHTALLKLNVRFIKTQYTFIRSSWSGENKDCSPDGSVIR